MILYPTETLYALGVNALNPDELKKLFDAKDRPVGKVASWLVRNLDDIERFAVLTPTARAVAAAFLPGQLTLVLRVRENIPDEVVAEDRTIGFRISADLKAQEVISEYMDEHDAPLTCTSANVSGAPTLSTPGEILQQFGPKANLIDEIVDDGPRKGLASTVVKIVDDEVLVLREGEISEWDIKKVLMKLSND